MQRPSEVQLPRVATLAPTRTAIPRKMYRRLASARFCDILLVLEACFRLKEPFSLPPPPTSVGGLSFSLEGDRGSHRANSIISCGRSGRSTRAALTQRWQSGVFGLQQDADRGNDAAGGYLLPSPPPLFVKDTDLNSTDLSPGMAIKMDGKLFLITETEHRTPGNLRAFVQIKIRDLKSGSLIEKRLRSGEDVEQVDLDRRQMEYLYQSGDMAVFMDLESYDQHELPKEVVGDLQLFVLPNTQIIVLWCDGKPISVELPLTVTL